MRIWWETCNFRNFFLRELQSFWNILYIIFRTLLQTNQSNYLSLYFKAGYENNPTLFSTNNYTLKDKNGLFSLYFQRCVLNHQLFPRRYSAIHPCDVKVAYDEVTTLVLYIFNLLYHQFFFQRACDHLSYLTFNMHHRPYIYVKAINHLQN